MRLIDSKLYDVAYTHIGQVKTAGAPTVAHCLSGRLYLSKSGWLLLDVPTAIVRGTFDALHEVGAELPKHSNGTLEAHVSVMTADEVKRIGADKIDERGHSYKYTLGPLKEVEPKGWDEMSKCWFIEISSPELRNLRKSYGLSPLPYGDHEFHATVAVRRKKVLRHNDIKKAAEHEDTRVQAAGVSWDGANSRIPKLAGYGGALREQKTSAIQGLWGTRNYSLSKVANELPGLLGRHGTTPTQYLSRAREQRFTISARELHLGNAQTAESQQTKQSVVYTQRRNQDARGMGRVDRDPLCNNTHTHQSTWLVSCQGIDNTGTATKVSAELAEEAMDKGAGIIMPIIRAGGLVTDIAGIRALTGKRTPQEPGPAEEIEADTSYLNQIKPRRKKRPKVVSTETSLTPLSMPSKLAEAVKMIPMEGYKQEYNYSCGPGALKAVFEHYDKNESEHAIRRATDASPEEGTRPEELAEHAEDKGLNADIIEHTSFDDLEHMIDSGEPVICNIQAWGDKEDYPKDESGHYVILTGYDDEKFYFKDPALGDKTGELLRREMAGRWHDEEAEGNKTDRLAIPVRKPGGGERPATRAVPPGAKKIASQDLCPIGQ
jgi:predicted double-glycine peptidase